MPATRASVLLFLAALATPAQAQGDRAAEAQALDMAKRAIAFRSVAGPGNQMPQLADYVRSVLVAGGIPAADIAVTPMDDTAYLVARWRGSDPKAKPLVISGHLDVVEARPSDWQRDPFTPVVENGYLYGRGATDMKLDAAIATAALLKMKRDGYRPRRDIVLAFSGDEETRMKTSAAIAEQLKNAELVLNIDGGGGRYAEDGKPQFFTWNGAEKTYADFELAVTNPGGHSSAPRPDNAIVQLSRAVERIGAYRFTPQVSDLTRTFFTEAAKQQTGELAAAMRAFAADPKDEQAVAVLAANPAYVGQIGTTCVPTMVSGGHALNALPQRATANVNCRIFPGVKPAAVMAELKRVGNEPAVAFRDVTEGSVPNDASPMRRDFVAAVTRALAKTRPGVPVFPSMSAGASDSMWFRYHNVPSYGASPTFIKEADDFSHGLNERTPVDNIAPGIAYYTSLFTDLSR
ncbi:M20/M25/M40 family metallo-hydrolase [Sphingomonas corticis]|jgi:acetylornithine deacetylase/succinyl-diaminopimelate desuccinylase-like protein|uniref:M20/M25/M40 family metallo-hydrolase n=1 Tax=Sphingomonas corticis TaxID=2722791 RepID=A0ABX1CQH5_9SPHN|nr:M20/M25/M40 family metallo-hydrolase [Sphingomonas corticis]NJR78565.1 M20/M25/M40 family metallo-hydrolase [Sphingomonas corticis]